LAVLSLIDASYPAGAGKALQRVENEFVGANCGIMTSSSPPTARRITPAARLPRSQLPSRADSANVALVIANTMVKHSIAARLPTAAANRKPPAP